MGSILLLLAAGCSSSTPTFLGAVEAKLDLDTPDWQVSPATPRAGYGSSVSGVGDVNGDGFGDAAIAANTHTGPDGTFEEGAVYLYLGSAAGLGSTESVLALGGTMRQNLGTPVNAAGDVNGDGYADVIAGGNSLAADDTPGAVFAWYGGATGPTGVSWEVHGVTGDDGWGWSATGVGDVNGDGYGDVAYSYPFGGGGTVFVHLGGPTGLSTTALTLSSPQGEALFGYGVHGVGDRDGDGYDDVMIGAPGWDSTNPDAGAIFLYRGSASGALTGPDWTYEGTSADEGVGRGCESVGDVDDDGLGDVAVAAGAESGEVHVFLAAGDSFGSAPVWTATDDQDTSSFGQSVAGVGDINGDGAPDLVIGAPDHTTGTGEEGAAYVYYGDGTSFSSTPDHAWYGAAAGDRLGQSVGAAGDVNGDGGPDFLVGSSGVSTTARGGGTAMGWYGEIPPTPVDTGSTDTGSTDTAGTDTGATDTSVIDTGAIDTGSTDTAPADTATTDSGSDIGGTNDSAITKPTSGCGCTTGGAGSGLGAALLGLALVGARRRR